MDSYKREQRLARDIQLAISKINHLTELIRQVTKQVEKCQETIDKATKELESYNERTT